MPIPLSYNVRNLLVRRWTTAFTAGGIALVVAATMLLSALVGGLKQMLVAIDDRQGAERLHRKAVLLLVDSLGSSIDLNAASSAQTSNTTHWTPEVALAVW